MYEKAPKHNSSNRVKEFEEISYKMPTHDQSQKSKIPAKYLLKGEKLNDMSMRLPSQNSIKQASESIEHLAHQRYPDSLISETKLSKQLRLPEFLVTVEEYNMIKEPPMRNFKQIETKLNMGQNDRLLGIKTNNFITRRA